MGYGGPAAAAAGARFGRGSAAANAGCKLAADAAAEAAAAEGLAPRALLLDPSRERSRAPREWSKLRSSADRFPSAEEDAEDEGA